MQIACWVIKAADTHSEYVMLTVSFFLFFFHGKRGYTNEPQCYVMLTLPVMVTVTYWYVVGLTFVLSGSLPDSNLFAIVTLCPKRQ